MPCKTICPLGEICRDKLALAGKNGWREFYYFEAGASARFMYCRP
jgi:hypothetical protein